MCIDGGSTRLQPDAGRARVVSHRLSDNAGGEHPRIEDLLPVGCVVAAIDAAAGEVDHRIAAVEFLRPAAECRSIPLDYAPRLAAGAVRTTNS